MRSKLLAAAGPRAFARGEEYAAAGRVHHLVESDGALTASVRGTHTYRTMLLTDEAEVAASCTCPVGRDGLFCKHVVAVGLAWLDGAGSGADAGDTPGLRACLAGRSREELVELLFDEARQSERLSRRILLGDAGRKPGGPDVERFRRALDAVFETRGFVDYREAAGFADRIGETIDLMEPLVDEGRGAPVIELAEYALAGVAVAMREIDDSDGWLRGVLDRLQGLHLEACLASRPDPEELARRLFEWEMRAEWDVFFDAVEIYADVLGDVGLAVYRDLAEATWSTVPTLGPGEKDPDRHGTHFRVTHVMQALARVAGDVDALVEVMARDLSYAYGFLRIAEVLRGAGRHDEALAWAERAMRSFEPPVDRRIREFLADEFQRRGRHDEAMEIAWELFVERPEVSRYEYLKSRAGLAGVWSAWRDRAVGHAREQIAEEKRAGQGRPFFRPPDHSELVRILIFDKDVDAAWCEAVEGGCHLGLWLELAELREPDHPEDAVFALRKGVAFSIARKNKSGYREATRMLRSIRLLHRRTGRKAEFAAYLAEVRATHKRKTNLMALLDRKSWD